MFAKTLSVFGVGTCPKRSQQETNNGNLLCSLYFKEPSRPLFILPSSAADKDAEKCGDKVERTVVTYGQMEAWAGRLASRLFELGVRRGERVLAQLSKKPEAVALYLGAMQLGAVYVPLNPDYKLDEVRFFIHDARPALLVCTPDAHKRYLAARLDTPINGSPPCVLMSETELYQWARTAIPDLSIARVGSDDVAAICYTSGTTGKPKGAMITHGNLATNAESLCKIWRISRQDVLLHALPVYHVHGLFVALNTVLQKGGSVVYLAKFDVEQVLAWLPRCSVMMGVPTYYTRLLQNAKFQKNIVAHMRLFVSGSAPLLDSTWHEFKRRSGHEILERYGMTEGQMVCSNPYDGPRKPGTVGLPLPGVTVRIRKGVLEYKGPNVFKGYWRVEGGVRANAPSDFSDDGYFISGDLAKRDENGYISILGRCKDLIISGGLNVYPKEIEQELDALQGVIESAVIGVPHSDFGEAVLGVVVTANNAPGLAEADLLRQLKNTIANYKVPKRVVFLDALPRNKMGKVQKNVLRDSYKHIFRN